MKTKLFCPVENTKYLTSPEKKQQQKNALISFKNLFFARKTINEKKQHKTHKKKIFLTSTKISLASSNSALNLSFHLFRT
jgi:hypothetical protein